MNCLRHICDTAVGLVQQLEADSTSLAMDLVGLPSPYSLGATVAGSSPQQLVARLVPASRIASLVPVLHGKPSLARHMVSPSVCLVLSVLRLPSFENTDFCDHALLGWRRVSPGER